MDRPAFDEVEVTPEMIEVGLEFLYGEEPWCSRPASKEEIIETLKLLYPAMRAAQLRRDRPVDEIEVADVYAATEAMIEAGGEIIHAMFAEPGDTDRFNSRYAAERVFRAMMAAQRGRDSRI